MALITHSHLQSRLKKEYSYISNLPLGLLGLFYGELFAFTFILKLLYASLRTARTETHTGSHQYMRAKPETRFCAITLVCSESYKFILLKNFVRVFVSFVNYNVRYGFQKYLHIFLHNLPFTHDTLNRCPAGSPCSSVHFTPLPMSLISAFSSRNWAVAS